MRLYIGIRNPATTFVGITLALSSHVHAQSPSARIHAEAPSGGATIGDPISITVSIDHPAGAVVAWPDTVEGLEPFEFASIQAADVVTAGDSKTTSSARIVVRAFETGELTIPSMTFALTSASGDTSRVSTTELPVTIQSVGLDESDDIRGIKPPLDIPLSWIVIASWLLLLAGLGAAGWYAYRKLSRRGDDATPAARPTVARPPHEIAHAALDALAGSDLLETGQIKRWYSEAAGIIRVYIEGRYRVAAMELTSGDILRQLESLRLDYEAIDQFRDFFARADLVKFAKHRPSADLCRSLVDSARKLVDVTTERPTATGDAVPHEAAAVA